MVAECCLSPASPLPLDNVDTELVHKVIKENSLLTAVKELIDSVDALVGRQRGALDKIREEQEDELVEK